MAATNHLNTRRWQRTRAAIRQRDGHRCQACGTPDHLAVHHIIPRTKAPDLTYEPTNLVTLCIACHNRIEPRGNQHTWRTHAGKRNARTQEAALPTRASSSQEPHGQAFFDSLSAHPALTELSLPAAQDRGGRPQSRDW